MPSRRFDRILTGTAIALVLGLAATASPALAQDQKAIEALVPMPEPANMPPPSIADIGGAAETTGSTPSAAVALPDPPELPPPAFKDVATPAAPPAPEAALFHFPKARRSARRGGRPASRIFFCAAGMSYSSRRSSMVASSRS